MITREHTLAEIAKKSPSAITVFNKYGIDYAIEGNKNLMTICKEAKLKPLKIISELNHLKSKSEKNKIDFNEIDLDELIDYVISKHHNYEMQSMPLISRHLHNIVKKYISYPELIHITANFDKLRAKLEQHLRKEEFILFPYIKKLVHNSKPQKRVLLQISVINKPLELMMSEHIKLIRLLNPIRQLSNFYIAPENALSDFLICFNELRDFDYDLRYHIHLENNILFPKLLSIQETVTLA